MKSIHFSTCFKKSSTQLLDLLKIRGKYDDFEFDIKTNLAKDFEWFLIIVYSLTKLCFLGSYSASKGAAV